jgi:hypothetical protein
MSRKKAREVLVLYDRTASIMYLYSMKDVLKKLSYDIYQTRWQYANWQFNYF